MAVMWLSQRRLGMGSSGFYRQRAGSGGASRGRSGIVEPAALAVFACQHACRVLAAPDLPVSAETGRKIRPAAGATRSDAFSKSPPPLAPKRPHETVSRRARAVSSLCKDKSSRSASLIFKTAGPSLRPRETASCCACSHIPPSASPCSSASIVARPETLFACNHLV